eukprot:4975943-Amphidinium_carterae.1
MFVYLDAQCSPRAHTCQLWHTWHLCKTRIQICCCRYSYTSGPNTGKRHDDDNRRRWGHSSMGR